MVDVSSKSHDVLHHLMYEIHCDISGLSEHAFTTRYHSEGMAELKKLIEDDTIPVEKLARLIDGPDPFEPGGVIEPTAVVRLFFLLMESLLVDLLVRERSH